MSNPSDLPSTKQCAHCQKDVPSANFELHTMHCSTKLERCSICNEMIPKLCAREHHQNFHAPVACSLCGAYVEREQLRVHKEDLCSERIVDCMYCELPLPIISLGKHMEFCGNRTEYCSTCGKYVRLCERITHVHDVDAREASSSFSDQNGRIVNASSEHNERQRTTGAPSRASQSLLQLGGFAVTMVIAGLAVIVGSVFVKRRQG